MNTKVIYTSIFGSEYHLHEPEVKLDGWDYICFTDNPEYQSDTWKVKLVPKIYDGARDSKKPKILPHRYLEDYDVSVWIDGDIKIIGDVDYLVDKYLTDMDYAVFNHEFCGITVTGNLNVRKCIYEEAKFIKWLGDNHPRKHYKDNLDVINKQVQRYKDEGYPVDNGQARNTIILRRHDNPFIIKTMEDWWTEVKYGSKRDQLSFPYVAWKNHMDYNFINEDIDNNKWFKLMKKWRQVKRKEKMNSYIECQPISLEYFLKMELSGGKGGKEIITQDNELKTVGDVVNFFKNNSIEVIMEKVIEKLTPANWQYYNCMIGEFRKDVGDHHELGWENMTEQYYKSLQLMNDEELTTYLKNNPTDFDNGYVRHSWHRACAMIGRLVNGKKYIPFYMETGKIYDKRREQDGRHRILPLINNIKDLNKVTIPKEEFTITQSGILAIMGIRQNDDVDIVISSNVREQLFNNKNEFIRQDNLEIFQKNNGKFKIFDAQGDDDIIKNYSFKVNGYNFLEPRFYFSRKNKHTDRDKSDWDGIKKFFEKENYKGYPFNQLTLEQLGIEYIEE
jgi:hypothetical protein